MILDLLVRLLRLRRTRFRMVLLGLPLRLLRLLCLGGGGIHLVLDVRLSLERGGGGELEGALHLKAWHGALVLTPHYHNWSGLTGAQGFQPAIMRF